MRALIKLLRPQQWLKNSFVFLPMFFDGRLLYIDCWMKSIVAFVAFSLVASSIYCLNDINDVEVDRQHPKKRLRPIASGKVSIAQAKYLMCICFAVSIAVCCFLPNTGIDLIGLTILYFSLNIAYCLKLKHYALLDVFIISIGFVLRVLAGGFACSIWLSPWIISMTFLLALFLAFAKRRDDVILREAGGVVSRRNTLRYNLDFLNQTLGIIASITMVCYILYTVQPDVIDRIGSEYIYISSIFVLAGILRYLQITIVDARSGSPTKVLMKDKFIHLCIIGWLSSFIVFLYF